MVGTISHASYLISQGNFSSSTNDFQLDGSIIKNICVKNLDESKNCVNKYSAGVGTYKYSLFGILGGLSDYLSRINKYKFIAIR